jgi:glycosyltransferase involved in cell wall biosynthesis
MMPDYRVDNPYQSLLADGVAEQGVEVVFPVGYRRGFPVLRAMRDNLPINVLHLHWTEAYTRSGSRAGSIGYWSKLLADLLLVRLSGVRIVWTLHNLLPHECRDAGDELFFRRLLRHCVDAAIVHGVQGRLDAIEKLGFPDARISVIPHGNYRTVYPPAGEGLRRDARHGLPEGHRVFLFFGMMRPYKGLERLLRVWTQLQLHNASLWLAGPCPDPTYGSEIDCLAAQSPQVEMHSGFHEGEAVTRLFAAADVCVLPFERVQTSGSVVLAMSFGKPVVAPRLGELPETLGPAADYLYEAGSDQALAAALRRAWTDDLDDISRRTTAGCDRLDWNVISRATADVYMGRTRSSGR